MHAKKNKPMYGGKVTGARTRESFGPAAQKEYIRRVNAGLERTGEEPLSEAEEAQRRSSLQDMRRMKSLMGDDYRPVYTGGTPHKNRAALKEDGKFGGTGILTPMNLVEEILMSLPKKELKYGKGGTVKYRSGGRIYAENGDQVPPSETQVTGAKTSRLTDEEARQAMYLYRKFKPFFRTEDYRAGFGGNQLYRDIQKFAKEDNKDVSPRAVAAVAQLAMDTDQVPVNRLNVDELEYSMPEKKLMMSNGRTVKYRSGGVMKYENGGPITSGRDTHRPGREAVSYRTPTKEMVGRMDGFWDHIPMEPEQRGVIIPRELEAMERIAVRSGDPEELAEYEAAMAEFMDSSEYKEQQEKLKGIFENEKSQYAEAKAGYDTRKAEHDKVRDAMRALMNSRLQ